MRRIAAAVTAGLFVLAVAAPATGTQAGRGESPGSPPGTASKESGEASRGTGVLPNMAVEGDGLVRLQVGAFDPTRDRGPVQSGIPHVDESTLDSAVEYPWLVQVRDRRYAEVSDAIAIAGARFVGAIPDDTYLIRATTAQRAELAASPAVRWSGLLQPAWKLPVAAGGRQGILALPGTQTYRVYAFRSDPAAAEVGQALARMAGVQVVSDATVVFDVRATARQLPAIAALPGVQYVGTRPTAVPLNADSRWVNDTGIRDLYAATAPGRLTGAGQTAAVADTGINYDYDMNGRAHAAFRQCADAAAPKTEAVGTCKVADFAQEAPGNTTAALTATVDNSGGSPHRKMAAYFDLGQSGVSPRDDSAHGTHVAGSVTADYLANGVWDGEDGLAPGARLVFQAIGTPTGGLAIPSDDYQLWRQAYRPSDPADVPTADHSPADYAKYRPLEDARTHNNSYGLIVDLVDEGSADALDEFVWEHEDMVIAVSAGNGGPGLGTIGSPSVAKNDLSSCASANGRQPMASIDSAAIFSSHGPTGDGRLGVDVCTPGQIVVSAKGGSSGDDHYLQGTSMSSPVLVGLATLVRQYFWDGFGPAEGQGLGVGTASVDRKWNPSAALVKATLVNGATRMRGFYTGDEGNARPLDGQWPSAGQGFGLVNLSESLYFPGDQRATWYRDVYRADDDAFGTGAVTAREYTVDVAEGQPLDVTLAYTDAPTGLPAGTPTLVNNLDLEVVGPGGTYRGNVANTRTTPGAAEHETPPNTGLPDVRNPVERVRIAAPDAGTYTVRVRPTAVLFGPQGFALTASGRIAEATGTPLTGQPLQVDDTGAPTIADVAVERVSADTARLTFSTDEPTTATATATPAGGGTPLEFADVYTYSDGSPFTTAYATGPVETSPVYADRPVLGTRHEILLYGLTAGTTYEVSLAATDLADQVSTGSTTFSSPGSAFQPLARDIGQLTAGATDNIPSTVRTGTGWRTGTQLYAGYSEEPTGLLTGLLAAFMFRLPEGVDPATVSGAAVEMTGGHVLASMYDVDPRMTLDLLDEAVEPRWGTQNFAEIQSAQATSRVPPETGLLRGGGTKRWFTFSCADLDALRNTLSTVDDGERRAAFRLHSTETITTSLPSYEFGFNRRSQGPELRPRLVLFGPDGAPNDQTTPCDPATPAPTVTEVAVADGATEGSVTVTWRTQVPSNSTVLYREKGATEFVQVGTPVRSTTHEVQVFGLDPSKDYEFGVRSTTCNGLTTTADNGGAGWDFFRPEPPPRTGVAHYFTGGPNDQANKLTFTPTATFSTDEPTGTSPIVQTSSSLNDPEAPYDPAAAYWTGPYSGTIDAEVDLPLHVWSGNANAIALGADVDIVFFADPENTLEAQPDRIIGAAQVELSPGVTPTLNTPRIRVTGTVASELQVGIYPVFVNTGTDIRISYGAASTPSGFVVLDPAPEALPVVGPVPASSAGSTGLDLASVPTRTEPTAADLAAGTGRCGSVTSPEEPPTDGDGAGAPARTAGRTLPPTGAQALLSLAAVALLAGAALMRRRVS